MQVAEFQRKNATSGPREKKNNPVEAIPLNQFHSEGSTGRVSAVYAALVGFLLRGAEGLSDKRAERRMRRLAGRATRSAAGSPPPSAR